MASPHHIYFGTYTRSTSRGIYATTLDDATGALTPPVLLAEATNPSWITFSPDKRFLYAVSPTRAQAVGFAVNPSDGTLAPLPPQSVATEPANAPAHLVVDATGRMLIAANYGEGYVAAMPIRPDGTLGEPNVIRHTGSGPDPKRQEKPHVHSVTLSPDNRFVIVCDLGLDRIFTYAIDPANASLTPASPAFVLGAPGSGPRHFVFAGGGRRAYNITEMGATVVGYNYDAERGALTSFQTVSTLPPEFAGQKWAAEVRIHPNGRFLYASNRGHDSIAVFAVDPGSGRLTPVEIIPSGGKVPRNFALSPNGKWLVCAHQDSDNVTVFAVDGSTGRLTKTPQTITVPMAVCVQFYD